MPSAQDPTFTANDAAIIEGIRRGLRDEEIAPPLRLEAEWVTTRIAFLCEALGLSGRSALGAWSPEQAASEPTSPAPAGVEPEPVRKRRVTRRLVLAGGAAAAFAGAAGGVAWLRSGDPSAPNHATSGRTPTPPPGTASPTVVPTATPVPAASAAITSANFEIARTVYAPGQPIDATNGIFFVDTATGATEGVSVRTEAAGIVPGALFQRSNDDNSVVVIAAPAAGREWMVDRHTGEAWGWKMGNFSLISGPLEDHVVLEETRGANAEVRTGRFTVCRVEAGRPVPVGEFALDAAPSQPPGPAVVSRDAKWVDMWVRRDGQHQLVQFEVASGEMTPLFQVTPGEAQLSPSLRRSGDFLVGHMYRYASPLNRLLGLGEGVTQVLHRAGGRDTEISEPAWGRGYLSPDGQLIVRDEPARLVPGELPGSAAEYWPAVSLSNASSPISRTIRGAALTTKLNQPWFQPWLADSSAFVIRMRELEPFQGPDWEQLGIGLVARDGSDIERLPHPPGSEAAWGLRSGAFGPVPSPRDAALLSCGGRHLYNRITGTWLSANVTAPGYVSSEPWRAGSDEMAFTLAGSAIGEPQLARPTFLPPVVEEFVPPEARTRFQATGPLVVRQEASTVSPGSPLPAGASLELADLPAGTLPEGRLAVTYAAGETWVHVRSEAGVEGWVPTGDLRWG